jgi:DNA-binding MarR family transcriptional regulator
VSRYSSRVATKSGGQREQVGELGSTSTASLDGAASDMPRTSAASTGTGTSTTTSTSARISVPPGDAYTLTDVVARLRRVLRASIRADYPWESLPMAQVELLQSLAESAPARVGDLAVRLRLAPSTVSGLISQMMTAGLVVRGTDPADRRVAVVELSPHGQRQLADWHAAHRNRIATALDELDPGDRAAIDAALPALSRLVDRLAEPRPEPRG